MIRSSVFVVVAALAAAVPSAQITAPARAHLGEVVVGPAEAVDGPGAHEGRALGMVVDRFGTATMVWDRAEVGRYAAQRSPSGAWSTPQPIGCAAPSACGDAQLGVDDTGTVSVAWDVMDGPPEVVVAYKTPGGPWSTPVTLTTGAGREHGFYPDLAVAPNGAAAVSWLNASGTGSFVARKPAGRSWASTKVRHLRQVTDEVAIAADGTVLAAGIDSFDAHPAHALVKVFRPSRGWQPTVVLGKSGGDQSYSYVAAGPGHRAAVAWTVGRSPASSPSAVVVRRMNRHYRWAAAERISPWLGDSASPFVGDVLVEARGRITVLWHARADKATTRVAGHWVSRRVTPARGDLVVGGLATNESGGLAVPWTAEQYDEATGKISEEVHVSLRPAGALDWLMSPTLDVTFGGTSERGDPGYRPFSVGVLPDGSTVVCWFDLTNALVARVVR